MSKKTEPTPLREEIKEAITAEAAKAALEKEKAERAQKCQAAIQGACQQYRCALQGLVVIIGNQVRTDVQIVAGD